MLLIPELRAAFIHIPKTGGQTVEHMLGFEHKSSYHKVRSASEIQGYFRFCFVRDPLQRYLSAYRYTLDVVAKGWTRPDHLKHHPIRRVVLDMGQDAEDVDIFTRHVLRSGVSFLFSNIHYREQMYWIERGAPKFIGRTETLQEDMQLVGKILGIGIPEIVPTVNSSRPNASLPSTSTIDQIRRIYAYDYSALGYSSFK